MPFDKFEDVGAIDQDRRKAIAKSIRIISMGELKKLGEEMFNDPDRPWREAFLQFIAEHSGATFNQASAGAGVILIYSGAGVNGVWIFTWRAYGPMAEV